MFAQKTGETGYEILCNTIHNKATKRNNEKEREKKQEDSKNESLSESLR